MPDPNQPNQNQSDPAASPMPTGPILTQTPNPVTSMQPDLPPLPPDFQNAPVTPTVGVSEPAVSTTTTTTTTTTSDAGSAAPNPMLPPMSVTPKKKFGGGRIIATILGLFLLVGGIGAGIVLTQNQQLFQQKAAPYIPPPPPPNPAYQNDPNNCGAKGHSCNGGTCSGGQCSNVPLCGSGLNCNGSPVSGGSGCKQGNNNANTVYCCPAGQTIRNGSCSTDKVVCGDGKCETNEGDFNNPAYCPKDCGVPKTVNCGGVQCSPNDCHCQGGDACTSLKCEPGLGANCTGQGRSWCDNFQKGGGKTCCVAGYVCNPTGAGCVPGTGHTPPPGTGGGPTASCQGTKVYSSAYAPLTPADISHLTAGNIVNFCVSGTTSAGNFDKAKFTINGTAQPETTTKRPGSNDFCQSYTIKPSDTTIHAVGQIHHVTLGWEQ